MPPPPIHPPAASLPTTIPVPTATPPSSLLNRTQKFVEENKLLVIGTAILVASTAGYYLYSTSSTSHRRTTSSSDDKHTSSDDDVATNVGSSSKKKKKSKKKKRESKTGSSASIEPLLEERTPEQVAAIRAKQAALETKEQTDQIVEEEKPAWLEGVPSREGLEKFSTQERKTLATTLKTRGNKLYSAKKYEDAIKCYTKALEVADKEEAVFYSNRAACYQNMSPPQYEQVIKDCDSALKLDTTYVKALNRRATAFEALQKDEEALRDFTATSILEKFQNETATNSVDRVLKKLAAKKAEVMIKTREPKLPSSTFVASYLGAFRPRPKPAFPALPADSMNTGNNTLSLAFDALAAADYQHAFILFNEAIDQGISEDWKVGNAEALNMRGTFRFLLGDSQGAKEDFEKSLDLVPEYVQSLVKVASVHMELGDAAGAFGDFETAIRHNPNDPDIYYHRGQLYFVTNEFEKASADYEKSTSLDDQFVFSHVQHAVAQYKMGQTRESMASFRKILKSFPTSFEPLNYYGELLLDQQRFEDAVEKFDSAIAFAKEQKPINVLPFVNKALALFQWKQDALSAENLCKEALEIDADCDVAIATLAQLSLQQGRIQEAITWFEKSGRLARTEGELVGALTYQLASQAQLAFLQNYPQQGMALGQLAQDM